MELNTFDYFSESFQLLFIFQHVKQAGLTLQITVRPSKSFITPIKITIIYSYKIRL